MKTNWPEFYANRLGRSYLGYCQDRYKPFIDAIWDNTMRGCHILEIGCGTGTITQALLERPGCHRHILLDHDPIMLDMAKFRLREHPRKTEFLEADARTHDYGHFDLHLIHSHGVLEHYQDDDILKIVEAARHCSTVQIHYVPGLYDTPSYGDERLLPLSHWVNLLKPKSAFTFNDGLDYGLVIQ